MSRDELVAKGRSLGVERPELMTRVELGDEIIRRTQSDPGSQRSARGWLGIARDLVASVVESGLNLPDAAAVIRGDRAELPAKVPAPVATVTLAEIYATQGHVDRALNMLNEVLEREPEHPAARALLARLQEQPSKRGASPRLEQPELDFEPHPSDPPPAVQPPPAAPEPELRVAAASEPEPTPEHRVEPEPRAASEPEPRVAPEPEPPPEPEPRVAAAPELAPEPERAAAAPEPRPAAEPELPAPPDALPAAVPVPSAPPSLLVLRTHSSHPVVCWEVASLEVPEEGARLEIECLGFAVVGARPERREVTLQIDSLRGRLELPQFDSHTIVRAALGYRSSGAFVPVAIGSELVLRDDAIDVCFRPPLSQSEALSAAERALVASFAN
ncbi:MAG TPA: tetratricopeptide repeat protein [Polyangiaceae bacterium]|nr:tetratricopeptide repeat protein [Polyangiaceae bacterium]